MTGTRALTGSPTAESVSVLPRVAKRARAGSLRA